MPKKRKPRLTTRKGFDAKGRPTRVSMKSLHFIKDDFILLDVPTKRPRLKSVAALSQNFSQIKEPIKYTNREVRTDNTKIKPFNCTDKDDSQPTKIQYEQPVTSISEREVQLSGGDLVVSFISTITSDNELYIMTGVPTFVLFNAIVKHCEEIFGKISYQTKLSLKECVLLTFMKLKHAYSNAVLSILFKTITKMTCCKIFHETIVMLANVLSSAIYWPSIEEIKLSFEHFQKVRIVIDCIEIPVQRVKCLKSSIKTHSEYKKAHTIKYLTAVTPIGQIAFVSKGYPGNFSDTVIFTQSGLVEKLETSRNDIMVDKGFLIQNVTDNLGIRIIQASFLKKEKQFSKENALLNQRIAKARVHIERVNQRIKMFDIFKKPFNVSLLPRIDDIFIITCAIINLSNSGLDDNDNE